MVDGMRVMSAKFGKKSITATSIARKGQMVENICRSRGRSDVEFKQLSKSENAVQKFELILKIDDFNR